MSAGSDTTQTAVPRGERIAAGVLAVGWVGWFWLQRFTPVEWWGVIVSHLGSLHHGWESFLAEPAGDLTSLFNSVSVLVGVFSGLWIGAIGGLPLLIVGGLAVASGRLRRRHRILLWWFAFANALLLVVALIFEGRRFTVAIATVSFFLPASPTLSWHEGWTTHFENRAWQESLGFTWPFVSEMLLAAAVLWFTRRRTDEAQARGTSA